MDGNTLGGGSGSPRYYDHIADQVGARAIVVSNGRQTVAMEVVDNEGLFNTYADQIRAKVARRRLPARQHPDSSPDDERLPTRSGSGGEGQECPSGTNAYFANYLVQQSALAIEQRLQQRARLYIRYAEAQEPANLRQCWSSYPFIDNQLMPVMQAVGTDGKVDRHARERQPARGDAGASTAGSRQNNRSALDAAIYARRGEALGLGRLAVLVPDSALEPDLGGVGIEMAGLGRKRRDARGLPAPGWVGGSRCPAPPRFVDEGHPAGCRTLFRRPGRRDQDAARLLQRDRGARPGPRRGRRGRARRAARRSSRTRSGPDTTTSASRSPTPCSRPPRPAERSPSDPRTRPGAAGREDAGRADRRDRR